MKVGGSNLSFGTFFVTVPDQAKNDFMRRAISRLQPTEGDSEISRTPHTVFRNILNQNFVSLDSPKVQMPKQSYPGDFYDFVISDAPEKESAIKHDLEEAGFGVVKL